MTTRILITFAFLFLTASAVVAAPEKLRAARQAYVALRHPSEAQRVQYIMRLIRLRESFTRADDETLRAIDAEIVKHPMPVPRDASALSRRLIGRWQSPRHAYFYRADGTWSWDEETFQETTGTWHIEGNKFFQVFGSTPDSGEVIILLTSKDFLFGDHVAPYYLRRGKAYPWR